MKVSNNSVQSVEYDLGAHFAQCQRPQTEPGSRHLGHGSQPVAGDIPYGHTDASVR